MDTTIYEGKVKWFSARKNRGVIIDAAGEDVEFDSEQLNGTETIRKNTRVSFQVAYDWDRNVFAINITPKNL